MNKPAHFRASLKTLKRSRGESMTAKSAYTGGLLIEDLRTGKVHDYRNRQKTVLHTKIILPMGVSGPSDPAELWNAAEMAEKHPRAWVGRELLLSLPHDLDQEQNWSLLRQESDYLAEKYQIATQASLHLMGSGDPRNVHGHLTLSGRNIGPSGFGEKLRDWDQRTTSGPIVESIRLEWAKLVNLELKEAGIPKVVDHRSYQRQGLDIIPGVPSGKHGNKELRERCQEIRQIAKMMTADNLEELLTGISNWSDLGKEKSVITNSRYASLITLSTGTPQLDPVFNDSLQQRISRLQKKGGAMTVAEQGIVMTFEMLQFTINIYAEDNEPADEKDRRHDHPRL